MRANVKPLIGLLGVVIAAIAAGFNDQVTSIALSDVLGGFGIGHDSGTWMTTLYVTAEVIGMALSPWLLVTFTLRHFTLFVILLNAVSTVQISFSPDATALHVLRVLQGFSGGLTIPLLMTTALRVLAPSIRLYGLAVYAISATFTPALSISLAALWLDVVGWRFVFFETLPLCVAAAVFVWYGLPQDSPHYDRIRAFNWTGAVLLLLGFGSMTIILQQGDRLDWFNSPFISMLTLISVIAIPLFLINEWFHDVPLIKLQLLGRRNLAFATVALFGIVLLGQSSSVLPTEYLRQVEGLRPVQFYKITLLIAIAQLVLLPIMAFVLDHQKIDARRVALVGLALILMACVGCSYVTVYWGPEQFYPWQTLQAIGQPMFVMPLLLLGTNAVHGPEEAPYAAALINMPRAVAEATGVWLLQLIQRWRGGLHMNRLLDQAGQERYRLLQGSSILPHYPTPLLPNGQPRLPGSLEDFAQAVISQSRILTISDAFLIFAAITAGLMAVVLVLPERTLPPRFLLARGPH